MSDYINNPQRTFLQYYLHKWKIPFLLPLALVLKSVFIPNEARQAFDAPIDVVFSRPDAPGLKIPIRTAGGFTAGEKSIMVDILNKLPVQHIQALGMIGGIPVDIGKSRNAVTYEAGVIVYDTQRPYPGTFFRQTMLHEIGHHVSHQVLNSAERDQWKLLYNRGTSEVEPAFLSDYAQKNADENFAESYMEWTTRTQEFAFAAVGAAAAGHPTLLQKFLFMSSLFAAPGGQLRTYSTPPHSPDRAVSVPATDPETGLRIVFLPDLDLVTSLSRYYRTPDSLTLNNYTFTLNAGRITGIRGPQGEVIASNLSIALPGIVLDRMPMTEPPPGQNLNPVPTIDLAPQMLISPNSPSQYVPIQSDEGYRLMASEQALGNRSDPTFTFRDQIRPHGDLQATPAR